MGWGRDRASRGAGPGRGSGESPPQASSRSQPWPLGSPPVRPTLGSDLRTVRQHGCSRPVATAGAERVPSVALGMERCPEPTPVNTDAAPGVGSLVGEPGASAGWAPSARPEGSEANERPAAWTAPGSAEGRGAEVEGACGPLSPCRGQREARRRGYAEGRGRAKQTGPRTRGLGDVSAASRCRRR